MRRDHLAALPSRRARAALAFAVAMLVFAATLLAFERDAAAYPAMIRHNLTSCAGCHADPSGGGLLTSAGRGAGERLLAMPWGGPAYRDRAKQFLWGVVPLPEPLSLGVASRTLVVHSRALSSTPLAATRLILMQADARAALAWKRLRMYGSLGYAHEGALPASITASDENNLVSREHWIGVALGENEGWLLRAGRLAPPFGLRNVEHTSWVRVATRSDVNATQQHGIALAYSDANWRGEIMAIAGNLQIRPDRFRERGGAAYLERVVARRTAIGISSQVLAAQTDYQLGTGLLRQAHGVFARWAPSKEVVILAETNALLSAPTGEKRRFGLVSFVQLDLEPTRGFHVLASLEHLDQNLPHDPSSLGAWLGIDWFLGLHSEVRLDAIVRGRLHRVNEINPPPTGLMLLAQYHVYL